MRSETEIREELTESKYWQSVEDDSSVLAGTLKAKIAELVAVLECHGA